MATAIEKAAACVVAIAEGEIGYCEKASNAYLNDKTANAGSGNWTKYAAYFDAQRGVYNFYNGRKNGPAGEWCDMFVDWSFCQAFGIDTARRMLYQPLDSCGAGCSWSASYFRENDAFYSSPKIGDQIFFGPKKNENHTGLVVDVTDDKVITVEGNANNKVMRRTYSRSDGNIAGYGRPNFALVADRFEEKPLPPIVDDPDPEYITKDEAKAMFESLLESRIGDQINTIKDIPHESVKAVARVLLDLEAVDGGTPYAINPDDINLPYEIVRALVISARYTNKMIERLISVMNEGGEDDG